MYNHHLVQTKSLDAVSRAIQQIIFTGKATDVTKGFYIFEKSRETILQFSKGATKV